jgi:hypothetical protein
MIQLLLHLYTPVIFIFYLNDFHEYIFNISTIYFPNKQITNQTDHISKFEYVNKVPSLIECINDND